MADTPTKNETSRQAAGPFSELLSFSRLPTLLIILGAVLTCYVLAVEYFRPVADFSTKQIAAAGACASLMLIGALWEIRAGLRTAAEAGRFWATVVIVALLSGAIRLYEIENSAFYEFVSLLVLFGFIINHHLPMALRKPFYVTLAGVTVLGVFASVSVAAALFLVGVSALLIAICHLPINIWVRVAMLLAIMVVLALFRVGMFYQGWIAAALPIVASMFMYRLSVYLYDVHNGKGPKDFWGRVGYFFMFPNFVFPFFPVVDFTTFGRTYYNEDAITIYRRGASYMLRGLFHLILYRIVHMYFVLADDQVHGAWTFLQYIVANFGLYLKISGLFHLIVGLLLLFGFNLPETHTRFYFSNSFVDFWRRINIYWKDYMQKMVFNPSYMYLKRFNVSHNTGVALSIAAVFVATWFLHAYQWFWLTGTMLLSVPDILFWTILGAFLIAQTLNDTKPKKPSSYGFISPKIFLVIRTLFTFLFICLLWSFWTSDTAADWFSVVGRSQLVPALTDMDIATAGDWIRTIISLTALVIVACITGGLTFGLERHEKAPPRRRPHRGPVPAKTFYTQAALASVAVSGLYLFQSPVIGNWFGKEAVVFAEDVKVGRLNRADVAALDRGYYENLAGGGDRFNAELWNFIMTRPDGHELARKDEGVQFRSDYLFREFIPNSGAVMANEPVTYPVNQWGMADKDYTLEKPDDTFRIVMLGASRAMGWGIESDKRFETLLEDRFNEEMTGGKYKHYEILNFSVSSYDIAQRLIMLEDRASKFDADAMIYIAGPLDVDYNHHARMLHNGVAMPFDFMDRINKEARVKSSQTVAEIKRRLEPFGLELAKAGYQRLADDAKSMKLQDLWIYLPGPTDRESDVEGLTEAATESGLPVIDLFGVYDAKLYPRTRLDPSHPGIDGHAVLADLIFDRIVALQENGKIDFGLAPSPEETPATDETPEQP